jgi:molybdopterin-guanine dinucleotide biosynthesis protein A
VACDLPFVTGELFVRLAGQRENFEAVVPVQQDGRVQPLCALYRREPCLSRTEELIAAGERRPRVLLDSVRARRVMFSELADLPGAELFFTNVNTPDDYARAQQVAGGG